MCEAPVRSGSGVLGADRGELRRLALRKKFDRLYKRELLEFRDFLSKHPMLGADHPFGARLAAAVRDARRSRLEPGPWFRAAGELAGIAPRPRERSARAYRFNQVGQVAWYLGNDRKTAAVEVLREPLPGVRFVVARVEILESVSVLDLRLPVFSGNPTRSWILGEVVARRFIAEPTDEVDESRPQYRVPQYVADLARLRGVRGILYDSTRPSAYNNPEAWGKNLVLFEPFPRYELGAAELMEFGKLDYDCFSMERWPLRSIEIPGPAQALPEGYSAAVIKSAQEGNRSDGEPDKEDLSRQGDIPPQDKD